MFRPQPNAGAKPGKACYNEIGDTCASIQIAVSIVVSLISDSSWAFPPSAGDT